MTAGDWRRRLRRIARIARWELSQTTTSYNRRTLAIALVIMAVVGGIGGAALSLGVASPAPNTDIYRIGVADDSPYTEVIETSNSLVAREADRRKLETGEIDLLVPNPSALCQRWSSTAQTATRATPL